MKKRNYNFKKVLFLSLCFIVLSSIVVYAYTAGFYSDSTGKYTKCTYDQNAILATNSIDTQYVGRNYSVTFNTNFTSSMSTKNSLKLSDGTLKGNVSSIDNYKVSGNLTFDNWYLSGCDSSSNDKYYSEGATVRNLTATNNKTINATAQWKTNDIYKVALSGHTNLNNLTTNLYPVSGGVNSLTMNGYTFKGWKNNTTYDGVSFDSYDEYVRSISISPKTSAANIVLYAKWVANNYTVTYDFNFPSNATHGLGGKSGNGGNLALSVEDSAEYKESYTMTFDSAYTNIPIPTIKGWTFKGWNLENGSSGSNYTNGIQVIDSSGNAKTIQTWGNHTLKAVWVQNEYSITFNRNTNESGTGLESGSMSPIYGMKYDSTPYKLPSNNFKKSHNVTFDANTGTSESTYIIDYMTGASLGTTTYKTIDIWDFDEWVWYPDNTALGDPTVVPQSALLPTHTYVRRRTMTEQGVFNDSFITEYIKYKYPIANEALVKNLTATHNYNVRLYATWTDRMTVLPNVKKEHNKFIGWYSKPQGLYGDTDNGAKFVGQAGDKVSIDKDVTLYAWFNQNPTYTDIYEGTFFEGQKVSYADLLKLIGVSDYEDDYRSEVDEAISSLLESNPSNEEKEGNDSDSVEIDVSDLPDITDTDENGSDDSLRAQINASITTNSLELKITKVEYSQEWLDNNTWSNELHSTTLEDGSTVQTKSYEVSGDEIKANGLDTRTENIGYFTVYYEVTDNGIWNGAEHILEENGYEIDSPITLEYTRKCQISYNNPPKLTIDKTVFIFSPDGFTSTTAREELLKNIHESDLQDNQENAPWWSKKYTSKLLYDNRDIVGVKDVSVNDGWAKDHPERAEYIRSITTLEQIYDLDLTLEEKTAITGYKVIVDTADQFGKFASGELTDKAKNMGVKATNLTGIKEDGSLPLEDYQVVNDRTLQIVLINPNTDVGLIDSNTYKEVRYISEKYLGTLGSSYWNEYGKEYLTGSLKSNALNRTPEKQNGSFISGVHGNTVDIQINDYSE